MAANYRIDNAIGIGLAELLALSIHAKRNSDVAFNLSNKNFFHKKKP